MSGIAAIAERLKRSALDLESRHREATSTLSMRSQSATRGRSPRLSQSPRGRVKSVIVPSREVTVWGERDQGRDHALEVFRDTIHSNPKGVTLSAFTQKLTSCNLDLEASVIEGIFHKADADRDGILCSSEFVSLQHTYPTLVSCLYNRINRAFKERAAEDVLAANKAKLNALYDEDSRHQRGIESKREGLSARIASLKEKQVAAAESEAKLRNVKTALEAAAESCEAKNTEYHVCTANFSKAKQGSLRCQENIQDAQRHKDFAVRQFKTHEAKEATATERLREMQALVLEQEKEVQRHKMRTERAYREVEQTAKTYDMLQKEADKYEREVKKAETVLRRIEGELQQVNNKKSKCEEHAEKGAREVQERAAERDSATRQVEDLTSKLEELEECRRTGKTETLQNIKAQEDNVNKIKQEIEQGRAMQLKIEREEEDPVLHMEVKLRRQRESLEEEEEKLRTQRHTLSKITETHDPLIDDFLSPRGARSTTGVTYTPSDLSSSPSRVGRAMYG